MRKFRNIFIAAAAALLSNACAVVHTDEPYRSGSKASIDVEVIEEGAAADDHIHTVRLIVFDDALSFPKPDVNKMIVIEDGDTDAKKIAVTLEVNSNRDKAVAVVINEPATMSDLLDAVKKPSELEDMIFLMADAFNTNHTAPAQTGLPMTGIAWDISVTAGNDDKEHAEKVTVTVKRVVARIELWLKTDGEVTAAVVSGTSVKLNRTYGQGYIMEPDEVRNFGNMMRPSGNWAEAVWDYADSSPLELTAERRMVCAFYIPERACPAADDSDNPVLEIMGIECADGKRNATAILSEAVPEGGYGVQPVDVVRRNNIYRMTGTVKKSAVDFENEVVPWTQANQGVIIDPQYYLRLSRDYLFATDDSASPSITAETNYDRSDRGFPKGIVLGETVYYDKDGMELTEAAGDMYGWLLISMSGSSGDLKRLIVFDAYKDIVKGNEGYYSVTEVKAGNIIKEVRVTRL